MKGRIFFGGFKEKSALPTRPIGRTTLKQPPRVLILRGFTKEDMEESNFEFSFGVQNCYKQRPTVLISISRASEPNLVIAEFQLTQEDIADMTELLNSRAASLLPKVGTDIADSSSEATG